MKICVTAFTTVIALSLSPLFAENLPQPIGPVLLTVTGNLALKNGENSAALDESMLADIGVTSFKTSTIWTDGTIEFRGVTLYDLAKKLGITATELKMYAANDYSVNIPLSDATPKGPILAYAMNGKRMTLREKGPLWLVYPYDTLNEYKSEVYYGRSIWQLVKIEANN